MHNFVSYMQTPDADLGNAMQTIMLVDDDSVFVL